MIIDYIIFCGIMLPGWFCIATFMPTFPKGVNCKNNVLVFYPLGVGV